MCVFGRFRPETAQTRSRSGREALSVTRRPHPKGPQMDPRDPRGGRSRTFIPLFFPRRLPHRLVPRQRREDLFRDGQSVSLRQGLDVGQADEEGGAVLALAVVEQLVDEGLAAASPDRSRDRARSLRPRRFDIACGYVKRRRASDDAEGEGVPRGPEGDALQISSGDDKAALSASGPARSDGMRRA